MMKKIISTIFAASVLLTAMPTFAKELPSPEGRWEIEMRDSRYEVTLCGDDGTDLCAKLVWLGNGADNKENLPYLNTYLIDHAKQVGKGEWNGTLHIYGQQAGGTIKQVSANRISLQGCFLVVICKTYQMYRMD